MKHFGVTLQFCGFGSQSARGESLCSVSPRWPRSTVHTVSPRSAELLRKVTVGAQGAGQRRWASWAAALPSTLHLPGSCRPQSARRPDPVKSKSRLISSTEGKTPPESPYLLSCPLKTNACDVARPQGHRMSQSACCHEPGATSLASSIKFTQAHTFPHRPLWKFGETWPIPLNVPLVQAYPGVMQTRTF